MSREPDHYPIAFYLPRLAAGGAERTVLLLAGEFARRGHPVTIVVDRLEGGLVEAFQASGLEIAVLDAPRTLAALPRLAAWLRRRPPGVLISVITHNNVLAVWARWLARGRWRLMVCEHTVASVQSEQQGGWRYRIVPWLIRSFYPRTDAIVAVSAAVAGDLARLAGLRPEAIRVIPNPVVTPDYPRRAAASAGHPWFDPGQPPVFVAAGRLVPLKAFDLLLRAFDQVRRTRPARLLILGEGPERGRLEALRDQLGLSGLVDLPGRIDDPLPFFARAAAVVSSSRYEGFGLTLVEALACGTPVVSTDCPGGPSEILAGGRFGTLVALGDTASDAAGLARAMLATLDDRLPAEALKARAAEYEVGEIAARYLVLADRLMEDGS